MRDHYNCCRCGWQVYGSCKRYDASHCPECGGAVIPKSIEKDRYRNEQKLSPPPSIYNRLCAAIEDEWDFHIIYCNRMEVASTVARQIANSRKRVAILSNETHQRECRDQQIPFFNMNYKIPDGMSNMIIIADVVPDKVLGQWREALRGRGNKIVALKSIIMGQGSDDGLRFHEGLCLKERGFL